MLLSHLDTQWRWTERETIERFLPATVDANEALFDSAPGYVVSFEGAYRYQLLAEHDPERFARVAARVREGRWHVAGAPLDAFDANLPAPESILRHLLYGSSWLERRLGVVPRELLLPDCFGFPASLPTLAVHAGLDGFSTQKLRKGAEIRAAFGVPFAYGIWIGPDGSELAAALDPGEYGKPPRCWPGDDPEWIAAFDRLEAAGRPLRLMAYFGVGDKGGALAPKAVARLAAGGRPAAPLQVAVGPSDRIYAATTAAERAALPRHAGDLLLRRHGTGCYSANGGMKGWNRVNERLARAAETAATLAWRLGRGYPAARFERAWTRFLVRQMHDDLTGTAIPAAYRLSYGDEALAANDFAELLLDSMGQVARALDRSGPGRPVLVLEPHAGARSTLVEIGIAPGSAESIGSVLDAEGRPLPFQIVAPTAAAPRLLVALETRGAGAELLFLTEERLDPISPAHAPQVTDGGLRLVGADLEARFDRAGDLAVLIERAAAGDDDAARPGRPLLSAPVRLELLPDHPRKYPAWEIAWEDHSAPARARAGAPRAIQIVETGPLRAAIRIEREALGSRFIETWRLAAGSPWLEVETEIDWRTRGALLVASLPTTASSPTFLCDLGVGAVERPVASEYLYEVPAYRWSAVTDESGGPGLALLCDQRAGRSHPDAGTLRLTLIHSPATLRRFPHQATQDFGRHRVRWALAPLPAQRPAGAANRLAEAWSTPPLAFAAESDSSAAERGPRRSTLVDLGAHAASLLAVKRAEGSQRLLLRLRETAGARTTLGVELAERARTVEELDATERPRDPARSGDLPARIDEAEPFRVDVELRPWSLRTLAIELDPPHCRHAVGHRPLELRGTRRGFSRDGEVAAGGFDDAGRSFPLELTPLLLEDGPVPFDLAAVHGGGGVSDAGGGTIELPAGFAELWWLGASASELPVDARFTLGARTLAAHFPSWRHPLAAPDRLLFGGLSGRRTRRGWSRRAPLAWYATHLHDRRGRNLAAERGMLFAVPLRLDGVGGPLQLPAASSLRLVAATLVREPARPVAETLPLFDVFE